MNSAEVVMHEMERERVFMVCQFFRKSVRQSGKSAHRHAHCEILPLRVAGRNVVVIWIAADNGLASAHANAGTVSSFPCCRRIPVDFLQHCVVDFVPKCPIYRIEIRLVAVSGQLNGMAAGVANTFWTVRDLVEMVEG
jgi:hypothetical protein